MELNQYQANAQKTAIYPRITPIVGAIYCSLKLNGEAGEVAELVAKHLRDDFEDHGDTMSLDRINKIKLELGDVLWYVAMLAGELDFTLEDIAQANLEKLARRQREGKIKGSGSDR